MTVARRARGFISQESDCMVSNSRTQTDTARIADGREKAEELGTLLPFSARIMKIAPFAQPRGRQVARARHTMHDTDGRRWV